MKDGILYFVGKNIRVLFIADLDARTWTSQSTDKGIFDGSPDQLQRILGDERGMLYFTEEQGNDSGIHARDEQGRYYVVVMSEEKIGETTGLAFSPDGRYMFVSYQEMGELFMIWRRDRLPFQATTLDVKYHYVPGRR